MLKSINDPEAEMKALNTQLEKNLEITNVIECYAKQNKKRKQARIEKMSAEQDDNAVFTYKYFTGYNNAVVRKIKYSFFIPKDAKEKVCN